MHTGLALIFPVNRENTGKSFKIGHPRPTLSTKLSIKSITYREIPYSKEQGTFLNQTGKNLKLTGKEGNRPFLTHLSVMRRLRSSFDNGICRGEIEDAPNEGGEGGGTGVVLARAS